MTINEVEVVLDWLALGPEYADAVAGLLETYQPQEIDTEMVEAMMAL